MSEWTKHEKSLIHETMLMAYEQGIEWGEKKAVEKAQEFMKDALTAAYDKGVKAGIQQAITAMKEEMANHGTETNR